MSQGQQVGPVVDRSAIAADLRSARDDLHHLLATATPDRLHARSRGTAWTNEQLLFHMVFGFLIVRLLPLVRLVSSLPPWVGHGFARLLNTATVAVSRGQLRGRVRRSVFNRARMGWLCDHTISALTRTLGAEPEERLARGMPFPTGWDPYFQPWMSLADVYSYPVLHYTHHRAQLTLTT